MKPSMFNSSTSPLTQSFNSTPSFSNELNNNISYYPSSNTLSSQQVIEKESSLLTLQSGIEQSLQKIPPNNESIVSVNQVLSQGNQEYNSGLPSALPLAQAYRESDYYAIILNLALPSVLTC